MSGAQATTPAAAEAATTEGVNLLEQVLGATKQTERDRAQDLVKTLVEEALTGTVTFDRNLTRTFDRAIAEIDRKLSEQLNAIMHAPKFTKLEGAWRGLQLPGHEQRDRHQPEAAHAQRHQAGTDP